MCSFIGYLVKLNIYIFEESFCIVVDLVIMRIVFYEVLFNYMWLVRSGNCCLIIGIFLFEFGLIVYIDLVWIFLYVLFYKFVSYCLVIFFFGIILSFLIVIWLYEFYYVFVVEFMDIFSVE